MLSNYTVVNEICAFGTTQDENCLYTLYRNAYTYSPKGMHKNAHSGAIHNTDKVETMQMPVSGRMGK